ncbi:hypothetical protein [Pseudobacteriovorax antillogorgiicola]|uniref:Uncharacterized protein n=1 Tax=Pseudobacteriovorax antillogorgiicola TaxID=1513793 RepID=A0A1Y6BNJ4_9BACT|nr:hypothetical protein [Pseudobacteriovorax antillogorgiicola]TCS55475.1 hypothetical protein EDD56_105197 [Pseudobacteriovorax antillogorgiicola]SMF12019.1 hypothetical protein SAMN06296036_105127 [Pseudobacteriovorax antillogorgiicola]
MGEQIYLVLILSAWVFHDFMTWGPLAKVNLSWFLGELTKSPNQDLNLPASIHTSSTWAIDEREGVNQISGREQHSLSPWDMAA